MLMKFETFCTFFLLFDSEPNSEYLTKILVVLRPIELIVIFLMEKGKCLRQIFTLRTRKSGQCLLSAVFFILKLVPFYVCVPSI